MQYFIRNFLSVLFLLHLMLSPVDVYSQSDISSKTRKQFEKARKSYLMLNYDEAIEISEKLVKKSPGFFDASLLLADIYNELDSTKLEIVYLKKALPYYNKPVILYRLAEASYSVGLYNEAIVAYQKYLQEAKVAEIRKSDILRKIESCKFAVEAKKHPVKFQPKRLNEKINTTNDEYWPSLSLDQKELVFTRLLKEKGRVPHEDFFVSDYNEKYGWSLARPIVEINTSKNEGAQTLSANGRFLFFTACNRADGHGSCDIYYSEKTGGKWSSPKNIGAPVNSKSWETQPSLSSDNRYLYFSSNRAGGKGLKDIWRAEFLGFKRGRIKWGEPENLGDSINTPGNEISPFIHANNIDFYFASDYHCGMGGFDLFTATLKPDNTFSEAKNMGYPINTSEDEQGLIISADGTTAFFSSARDRETGLDIYTFELSEKMRPAPVTYARVKVFDADTKRPVEANIELVNLLFPAQKRTETANKKGDALLCFPVGANYAFNVSEPGYMFYSRSFQLDNTASVFKPYTIKIKLQPIKTGAEMNLYNIYFETDSFSILKESEPELQKLVAFLKINSSLTVEVQGHTDNSGSSRKNLTLSEMRAKSVEKYLVQNGISTRRLHAVGYGETRPVATNKTKEGRKLNRRTTIKIVSK